MDNPTPSTALDLGNRTVAKVNRRILPIVGLLYVFNYMDRSNISYAQLGMSHELAISTATFGTAAGIFFLAYVLFEVPSTMMLNKVGARLWLARITVSWGIVSILMGFVQNVTQLYIARILLGVAEAGLFPGVLLYLTFWFRSQDRGGAIAKFTLAQPIALVLGSFTGGLILDRIHWFGLSGWRWVFILQAVPAIIIGVVTLVYLPNRPSKARFLTMEESSWLEGEISAEYTDIGHVGIKAQLRAIKNPRVLYLSVALFFAAVGFYGFTFFFPQIIKQLNSAYSATNIGFLGAIPFLVGGVGMVLIGRNSDRTMERRYHAVALSGLAAVGLLGTIAFRHNPVLAIISLCMVAVGVLSFIAPFWAMASEGLSKGQTAVGLPMINTIAALGGFFGPYVVGKNATTGNVTLGLYFPIAALIICGVMLLFWKVNRLYATNLGRGPRIREAP